MAADTTSLKLGTDLRSRYKKLALARERSSHWLMKEALAEYIEREEKRESFRRDAIESWEEYEANGLHLTGEEVAEWLRRRASGEEVDLPECHT